MPCIHFPDAINKQCPLCFPEAVYEIEQQIWKGEPIIEVLRDGEAWASPWDRNFRFGRIKTAMIWYCIDRIQDFALTNNPGKMIPLPFIREADPDLIIQLQTFPLFRNADGNIIEGPFLRLDHLLNKPFISNTHIGFGKEKAAALVILKNELLKWLQSIGGWKK
ncbi:MAG TPA: hypothetical protein ACFYEH_09705 [Candidatus Brocadiaceae bacterium]